MDRCLHSRDYCNSLFSDLPASSVQSHRRVQHCSARLILKKQTSKPKQTKTRTRKADHITPLFEYFRWFPIQQRIQYKINSLCYNCITGTAPFYLCDCLQLYTPSRTLRSASDTLSLQIPRTRLSTVGSRAFYVFGPSAWNDLPLHLRQKPSLDSLKFNLKTFLFPILDTCHVSCSALMSLYPFQDPGAFAARLKLCMFTFV